MTYAVDVRPAARKALRSLHPAERARVVAAIELLAQTPRPPAARPLVGRPAWRVRVGDYRVIYEIHDGNLTIVVITVGHRQEVYRQ